MTAEELKECQDHYWINGDDIDRTITEEDIFHKWVVTRIPGLIVNREGDRHNDRHYIRFMPDGTVEGKYDNARFKGTYTCKYDAPDEMQMPTLGWETRFKVEITPDADGGSWPGCFRNFDQGVYAIIYNACHLAILSQGENDPYQFIRGFDD